ncbi:general secretion pathway protein J [Luteibacter rhizovicinus]|uniref:General secretion pathway protein J n=1 Tax=Luteibacter rhizovicinus TaxID=242606 RepID=A0A4R3YGC3_9GAMM|nr:prepilin-type N-terminal cleavage/methylation domain-containing protein [Luteibacter rhizovicinus]TCV91051.1 general secretion pathway protein J [Luteibacter rhizovicinus]
MTRAGGFSLLEVLAALALLALLLLGVYSGVRSATFSVSRGSAAIERLDEIRGAREFLRRELAEATALPWKVDGRGNPVVFDGDDKGFRFVAPLPGYLGKLGPQVQTVRIVDEADGTHSLKVAFSALPLSAGSIADAPPEVLIARIRSVRFRYALSSGWVDRRTGAAELPKAVSIEIVPDEGVAAWPLLVVATREGDTAINARGIGRSLLPARTP